MLFDLFRHTISAFVWMELPPPLASGANRIFRLTFAEQWKSRRFNVLPQLSVLYGYFKHDTCVTKFIQFMCLILLRFLQQTKRDFK